MTDSRGRLADDPFDWRERKDGTVAVSRGGRTITLVRGSAAARLLDALAAAPDDLAEQLVLAKVTGHYRHGTER